MKKKLSLAAVLFAIYLVVSAAPVMAANTALVATSSTSSDLGAGTTSNAVVERSGEPGYVGHETYRSSAVARWSMDVGSGSTAFDHIGSNDGSISGASWVTGVKGSALSFDGNDYARVPHSKSLNVSNSFTVSAWVKPSDLSGTHSVVAKANGNRPAPFDLQLRGGGEIWFVIGDGTDYQNINTSGILSADVWQKVTISYDGTYAYIYHNGSLKASEKVTVPVDDDGTDLYVGKRNDDNLYMVGGIDETRVYSEALTPGQAVRLEKYPNAKLSAHATERWALDAGSGSTAFGDEGSNGDVVNGTWTSGKAGSALKFDGDGMVNATPAVNLDGQTSGLTLAAWVRPAADSRGGIVGKGSYDGGYHWSYVLERNADGTIQLDVWNSSGDSFSITSTETVPTGSWSHVAGSWNGTHLNLYINGSLVESKAVALDSVLDTSRPAYIGTRRNKDYGDKGFNGSIDEARIYSGAVPSTMHLTDHPAAAEPETSSYTGSHAATNTVKAYVDLELVNASATVTVEGSSDGGSSWTTLNQTTFSSSGNHSLTWSEYGGDDVRIDVDFDPSHPDHIARLHEHGVYATNHDPTVDDSSLTPNTTSETVDSVPVTLEANITDPEFATAQGESLTVEWFVDGSLRGTTSMSSNGTASYTLDSVEAGEHNWTVEVTDNWGGFDKAPDGTKAAFAMPSELEVRNETGDHELIKGSNVTVEVRFYSDGTVESRSTSDGTLNMTGLPADERFVVTVDTEGFYNRRIVIDSLTSQQSIYLLNKSYPSYEVIFDLEDKSGNFPADKTTLKVQKAVNLSGGSELNWVTITGDRFAADGRYPTNLAASHRYRIVVVNSQGERRNLGSYTPYASTTTPLTIGKIVWEAPNSKGVSFTTSLVQDQGEIEIRYNDTLDQTESINYTIRYKSNGTIFTQTTVSDADVLVEDLDAPTNHSYVINFTADRSPSTDYNATHQLGRPYRQPPGGDTNWIQLGTQVFMLGIAGLLVGRMPRFGGLIIVPFAFGVTWLGLWQIHPAALGLAGAIALVAAANKGGAV